MWPSHLFIIVYVQYIIFIMSISTFSMQRFLVPVYHILYYPQVDSAGLKPMLLHWARAMVVG